MASKSKSTTAKKATKQSSTKKKMGRPQIKIDEATFKKLCGMMCTLDDIAGFFDCSPDTIERWCKRTYDMTFAETYKRYSAMGKVSLRKLQFKLAEKSAPMAIFLGKQYLGQQDHIEVVDNTPIERLDAILGGLKDIAVAQQGVQNNGITTESETE